MDIKEEDPLSEDVVAQNEIDLVRNSDDVTIKSETSPKYFAKEINFETVTCSNNWKTETEEQTLASDFGSQNEGEFLPENPVMNNKTYDTEHDIDNKIEIKVEPSWLETETSTLCDDIKDGDVPPVTSSRLHTEAVSGAGSDESPLPSTEVSERHASFYNADNNLDCEYQKSDVTEMPTSEEYVLPEQSGGEMYISPLYLKQKNLIKSERPHKCNVCAREFSYPSQLKTHNLIHEGKKPHQCKICDKSFTRSSHLKTHNLAHEGNKPHQCNTCHKSFTRLGDLRRHYFIHEGKKPHQCKTCDKSFTFLSDLKKHDMIHEGKKPHKCKICDKSFTRLTHLKTHHFVHEDKRPHQCQTCDKSFAQFSDLKTHNLIHEGKKPHKCKICNKSFTQLSHLKTHSFIHDGKKPHQCKTCNSGFARLGDLKTHNLIHEGKK